MSQQEQSRLFAERYNTIADRYLRHWAAALVEPGLRLLGGLDLAGARRVLEVAAGTGRLLAHIATAAPTASVTAIDLSEGMIRLAPKEFARVVADVTSLPLRDDVFDAGLMAFALFHVLDPTVALSELGRVLRPGAGLGVGVWAASEDSEAERLFMSELDRLAVPEVTPRPSSAELLNTEDKLSRLLEDCGFTGVRVERVDVVDPMDVEEFLERSSHLGLHGDRFKLLGMEQRPGFIAQLRSLLGDASPDDLASRDIALLAWARTPG